MTPHAPKLRALETLVADRLSERGRTRLERHLARCETCRAALGAVREYERLRAAARDLPMPELSFERFERALEQHVGPRKAAPRNGKLLALVPVLAIAATAVIGWVGISGQRQAAELALRTPAAPVQEIDEKPVQDAAITGWVTLGAPASHAPGSDVLEGATLRTGVGEELHVHLARDTGIVLGPESELVVTRLREHRVRLSLVRGSVSNVVRKLAVRDSYVVEAGTFSAEVRGTRFFVARRDDSVQIAVQEGQVAVLQHGKHRKLLSAGESFSTDAEAQVLARSFPNVNGLELASRAWPSLSLPPLPQVAAWHVGETRWAADTELSMRAAPGDLTLSFEDARGKLHPFAVTLAAEGTRIEEAAIRAVLRAQAEARMGTLAPELITPVIQRGLPGLRRCYERGLRRTPVEGRLTLSVRVAADGRVARAELGGEATLPLELTNCIANQARGWIFPAPDGGPVAFEVPLNLKAAAGP